MCGKTPNVVLIDGAEVRRGAAQMKSERLRKNMDATSGAHWEAQSRHPRQETGA